MDLESGLGSQKTPPIDEIFATIGTERLTVRLACTADDIAACQRLRYDVFYEELNATPDEAARAARRDVDAYDELCDHLMVIDTSKPAGEDNVVGTYRFLRRSVADQAGKPFYSAGEYDIAPILDQPGELLELGRSAVAEPYRTRPTMQLLWRGLSAYVYCHDVQLMFGCASMPGVDVAAWQLPLAYLYHHHLAPPALRVKALPEHYVDMNTMDVAEIDPKKALSSLPPLLKGYLRVGCFVGDGAFVDRQWDSVDVFIVIKTESVTDRYFDRYIGSLESFGENS